LLALGLALAQHRGEGVVEVAGARVHGESRGLVDDDEVLVLVGHSEIALAGGLGIPLAAEAEFEAGPDRGRGLERTGPVPEQILLDDALDAGAGEAANLLGQVAVESPPRVVLLHAEGDLVDLRLGFLLHGALLNRFATGRQVRLPARS